MSDRHSQPFFHTTPTEALGELLQQQVAIGDRTFQLIYPGSADALLDHPSTQTAFDADQYLPYWAELWPAALMLSRALVQETWLPDWTALEIGCGVGLPGITALSLGMRVIFSDYDATALQFAARNAEANGFSRFETLLMDWRCPPPDLRVPLILAADVIYEERHLTPLVQLIQSALTSDGVCWLSDPDRPTCKAFQRALTAADLTFQTELASALGPEGQPVAGRLYRIRRRHYKFEADEIAEAIEQGRP